MGMRRGGKWRYGGGVGTTSDQRLVEQAKASMVEQCAAEVESAKSLLTERLRKEQKRHAKAMEEREKSAEEFCVNLQAKYEDLLGFHAASHQHQLHVLQESLNSVRRTHISLEDHELILHQKTANINDSHAKVLQEVHASAEKAAQEALYAQERAMTATHQAIVSPLHTQIAELQVKCNHVQRAVDDLTKQLAKSEEMRHAEVLRRTQAETKLHECTRHLMTMRNQVKKATAGIAESKTQAKTMAQQVADAQGQYAELKLTLVTSEANFASMVKCLTQDIQYLQQSLAKEESSRAAVEEKLAAATSAMAACAASKRKVEARELLAKHRLDQLQSSWDADVARWTATVQEEREKVKLANEIADQVRGQFMDLQRESQVGAPSLVERPTELCGAGHS
ncbi:hypothetical protein, variant 1 [Aphanomyces invadans]|uniref:Uncharacterized protein n=1 Tax=Aphanomyces invadans TaxID=157072 RepID=A0A024UK92_9STRA|nr:hypothetical protein, variant 1 [Aphanomyces invadans]ETW06600.1 hypothetical protein, variant 1 [Aphanomyces invadans]|eukprot:XP_008864675.1 hypothetical protein, variant 1 [Aphanomyces invadans]